MTPRRRVPQSRPRRVEGRPRAAVRAEITEATLQALPALLNPCQDGYHDTSPGQPAPMWELDKTPMAGTLSQRAGNGHVGGDRDRAPAGLLDGNGGALCGRGCGSSSLISFRFPSENAG